MDFSANFTKDTIDKINRVLKFALENKYSDFYRKKYGELHGRINGYADFQKIPFLTKDEFLNVPLKERTFTAPDKIKYYSFSSGTSGSPKLTVVPHSCFYHHASAKYHLNPKKLKAFGVKRLMILMPPLSAVPLRTLTLKPDRLIMIPGDPHNLKLTAMIARETGVQALITTPAILDAFITELKLADFNFSGIKWLYLGSEFSSSAKFFYFKNKFPQAYINMRFGHSEIGGTRHYQCRHLANRYVNIFHIDNSKELTEIADAGGRVLPLGQAGEIVHTDLTAKAFPLIRYRTKDMGSLAIEPCPCGNNFRLTVAGRAGYDILKYAGVTINAEMAARALAGANDLVEPKFQIHVYEEQTAGGLKPRLVFHLEIKSGSVKSPDEFFKAELLEKISANFYLSAKTTLSDLVKRAVFLPPEIVFVRSWPPEQGKFKNIISHLP